MISQHGFHGHICKFCFLHSNCWVIDFCLDCSFQRRSQEVCRLLHGIGICLTARGKPPKNPVFQDWECTSSPFLLAPWTTLVLDERTQMSMSWSPPCWEGGLCWEWPKQCPPVISRFTLGVIRMHHVPSLQNVVYLPALSCVQRMVLQVCLPLYVYSRCNGIVTDTLSPWHFCVKMYHQCYGFFIAS